HGAKRRAQIVRDRVSEALELGHGLTQARVASREFLSLLPSFREIPGDLTVTDRLAIRIAKMGDQDAGPKARAVLAPTPPFHFDRTPLGGLTKIPRGRALRLFLRDVEKRDRAADDLVGPPAENAFGALVPDGEQAFEIVHVDRVVARPLHEQAKPLFAFA